MVPSGMRVIGRVMFILFEEDFMEEVTSTLNLERW